ncbi:MAG: protoheme IX farnesyltransferase [Candidatus Omnitrophica bacterium]|nr:protoheme IX farnesyltransferase [Candidatus Omnitrophota bacterium]
MNFQTIRNYLELAKPRLIVLVILSSMAGFYLASQDSFLNIYTFWVALGLSIVSAGSQVLNQWMERVADSLMRRTQNRPIPTGRVSAPAAFGFGVALSLTGLCVLALKVNAGSCWIAAVTLFSYIALYTPLKKITPLCTLVGAVPGALPPVAGWAAAQWPLHQEAWILFLILFLWQMPHFFAISWIWRDDYIRAGFRMISVEDATGKKVARHILIYTVLLLPASLLPVVVGMNGLVYLIGAVLLGIAFVWTARCGMKDLNTHAKLIFRMSIIYLTILLILMVVNKTY